MSGMRDLWRKLRALWSREQLHHDIADEFQFHIEQRTAENLRQGMAPDAARREAEQRFGPVARIREDGFDARTAPWLDSLLQDVFYSVRSLRKSPAFAATAILTLALGIGVNATMFSLISVFLLRQPPVHEPERVVVASGVDPAGGYKPDDSLISVPNYLAWREANTVFSDMAAVDDTRSVSIGSGARLQSVHATAVSANYFQLLEATPQYGRVFEPADEQPGRDHVVLLSYELWQRDFGADPSLVGRTVRLNREDYTVIGVMPSKFRLLGFIPRLWIPLAFTAADRSVAARRQRSLFLMGRLRPGATLAEARAEMAKLARRAEQDFADTEKGWGVSVRDLPGFLLFNFDISQGLAVMMTTVGFVLMIACANVSGLLLARASSRRKEIAIRLSLGAGRRRLVRQLMTESLAIAVLGGSLGLAMSYWGIGFMRASLSFNDAFSALDIGLDANVMLFCAGISLASALLCGIVPSLRASRSDILGNLKTESRGSSPGRVHNRLRKVLVTGEITLALFLLVGTGLLLFGISRVWRQPLGFVPDHLLVATLNLDSARYKGGPEQMEFVRKAVAGLQQIPGAEIAAAGSDLPATGAANVAVRFEGEDNLSTDQGHNALRMVVTPAYFQAARITLLRGRGFAESDVAQAPRVVVVNQKFVDRYLAGKEPLGTRIQLQLKDGAEWSEIVGVVGTVRTYSELPDEDPAVYEDFFQHPVPSLGLLVRSTVDPESLAANLRNVVAQLDVELPLAGVMSMPAVVDRQHGGNPFFLGTLASFAVLSLLLAAIGIYGLIAYSVGQRRQEIGIRMAVGARRYDVVRMILREGLLMAAIGGGIGFAMALPLPWVFEAMFATFRFREPLLYASVPAAILLVTVVAAYLPARRAAAADPMLALRAE